jgi:hypothetical protein
MTQLAGLMYGFYAVLGSDLSQRFPRLRWGFIEGGATFTLPIMHQHARRDMSIGVQPFLDPVHVTPEELEDMNVYIALETDEDIPYLVRQLGEHTMVVGTDFGHNDLGSELGAHQTVLARKDLPSATARKIADDNGRELLNISSDYRPASGVPSITNVPHIKAVDGGPAHIVPSWVKDQDPGRLQRV